MNEKYKNTVAVKHCSDRVEEQAATREAAGDDNGL